VILSKKIRPVELVLPAPRVVRPLPLNSTLIYGEDGQLDRITTVLDGGYVLAWDMCVACAMHVRVCTCSSITPAPWIVRQSGAVMAAPSYVEKVTAPVRVEPTRPVRPAPVQRAGRPTLKLTRDKPMPVPTKAELDAAAAAQADSATARLKRKIRGQSR
jgi:hypothetical protein